VYLPLSGYTYFCYASLSPNHPAEEHSDATDDRKRRHIAAPHEKRTRPPDDLRALTPLIYAHVTPYGTFKLDMQELLPGETLLHNDVPMSIDAMDAHDILCAIDPACRNLCHGGPSCSCKWLSLLQPS
jgi:hypothetical protein